MRGVDRLRRYRARGERAVQSVMPLRRTALRTPPDQVPPHPSAFAAFGTNSWVVPPARVVNPERIAIGDDCVVMEGATLAALDGGTLRLGNRVVLARYASIVCSSSVTIEDGVLSSDGVIIGDSWRPAPAFGSTPPAPVPGWQPPPPAEPIHIGRGAYLSFGSAVLPGVTVGEGAYVAEFAVVTEDVPPHSVAQGNPAQIIRRYDPEGGTWEGRKWP